MDVNSPVYHCKDPPISIPNMVMKQEFLATFLTFMLILFVYRKTPS